jgi:hypothetical protein
MTMTSKAPYKTRRLLPIQMPDMRLRHIRNGPDANWVIKQLMSPSMRPVCHDYGIRTATPTAAS